MVVEKLSDNVPACGWEAFEDQFCLRFSLVIPLIRNIISARKNQAFGSLVSNWPMFSGFSDAAFTWLVGVEEPGLVVAGVSPVGLEAPVISTKGHQYRRYPIGTRELRSRCVVE